MISGAYASGLDQSPANHVPLTPLGFLDRAALVHPERVAIIHGELQRTWAQTRERCYRLASSLAGRGIQLGDTVSILSPNTLAMVEAHHLRQCWTQWCRWVSRLITCTASLKWQVRLSAAFGRTAGMNSAHQKKPECVFDKVRGLRRSKV